MTKSQFRLIYTQCGNHCLMSELNELSSQSPKKRNPQPGKLENEAQPLSRNDIFIELK